MNKIESFRDLKVWQKAHQLVLDVYQMTKNFPTDERYGLVSQMRRAAVSVPANIAEGFKRKGKGEKVRFYNIGEASLEELKYFFILSKDLEYISDNRQFMEEAEIISKMLYRLIEAVNNSRR
ncbi:MAG: four helix bundle protein [Anaerolineae bacterium]|nr:four helix bundle protein [Anaerolineae bacterium]